MVIYEGLGHSQPTTASCMIQKVSKNRAVALLPRFRPISRWFPPKFPNRKNEWNFGVHYRSRPVWWSYTVLYGLGRPDAFLECSGGASNEPLPCYYGNCRFGILRCSFNLEHCVVLEFLRKKLTNGIQKIWMFLKDRDLIQTMLLEWRKSIDTCCEGVLRKISTVRYPSLTDSLKYLPSYYYVLKRFHGQLTRRAMKTAVLKCQWN